MTQNSPVKRTGGDLSMLNTSQFSQLIVACLIIDVLQNFCMVNPPERRGISAQVFLLYPFCAGSGADTELTGRHPAPCIWLTDT